MCCISDLVHDFRAGGTKSGLRRPYLACIRPTLSSFLTTSGTNVRPFVTILRPLLNLKSQHISYWMHSLTQSLPQSGAYWALECCFQISCQMCNRLVMQKAYQLEKLNSLCDSYHVGVCHKHISYQYKMVIIKRNTTLQELVVLPANTYLLKNAFCSPSHQLNNTTSTLSALNLPSACSQQSLAA